MRKHGRSQLVKAGQAQPGPPQLSVLSPGFSLLFINLFILRFTHVFETNRGREKHRSSKNWFIMQMATQPNAGPS